MIEKLILIAHVLTAASLIGLILVQQGKGADMGASFGSGSSQTLFGSAGNTGFLTRLTTALAIVFFATSFGLAIYAKHRAVAPADDLPVIQQKPAGDLPVPVAPPVTGDVPAAPAQAAAADVPAPAPAETPASPEPAAAPAPEPAPAQ